MKATMKFLAVIVSLGVVVSSLPAWAGGGGSSPSASSSPRGAADDGDKRAEASKSLRLADQAMKEGNLPLAEYYIERAEKLNVAYDPATAQFENTPAKARQKLAQLKAGGAKSGKASAKPAAATSGGTPADPFAARHRDSAVDSLTNDSKAKAKMFLEKGRAALTAKDLVGATSWYQKAVAAKAQFGPGEYSPETLAAELRRRGVEPTAAAPAEEDQAAAPPSDEEVRGPAERVVAPAGGDFPSGGDFAAQPVDPREIRAGDPLKRGAPPGRPAAAPLSGPQGEAFGLVSRARAALDRGDLETARKLAQQAEALQIPEEAYSPELIPWVILLDVNKAAARRRGAAPAGNFEPDAPPASAGGRPKYPVSQGLYDVGNDRTKNMPASQDTQEPTPAAESPQGAQELFDAGLKALADKKRDDAMRYFNQAWERRNELEPRSKQQLQDQMNSLRAGVIKPAAGKAPSALETVDAQQQLLQQKLAREIQAEQAAAEKMRGADPHGALEKLKKLRDRIRQAQLDPQAQKQLLIMADRGVLDTERYIETNKGKIELDDRNRTVQADVDRDRLRVIEVQNKLAQLVEEFNKLIDQERYAEAEVIAKQANELDPENPVVTTLVEKSRFVRRIASAMAIRDQKERGFHGALESVDEASKPFDDRNPIVFGDPKRWAELTGSRQKMLERQGKHLAPSEREIQQKLLSPVRVEFTETPLAVALDTLGKRVGINIVLDPQGLAAEGITSDTPITMNLGQEISLRSVLNIMLDSLRLSYVIQNEVLKVTSAQAKDSNVYAVVYNVADLVIPIPNFVPGYNVGLPAALRDAYNSLGYGSAAPTSGTVPLTVASNETAAAGNASVLAQMASPSMNGTFRQSDVHQPRSAGPGGLGGGAKADFDTLIDLITTTIAPTSWDDNGGAGSVSGFDTNLSLVVSQTQDVHEQIADLLEQLRRLQDLQVTIEVRFITLQDDFFERIGVQFDFSIKDNSNIQFNTSGQGVRSVADQNSPSAVIGLGPPVANIPNPTAFGDIDFRQGGFASAVPQFGGFDANTAANFGFAILSDIEVFLFVQASQGDNRSNILQAPKVTLFNGQQATISDSSQTPFVTSIIPVVGDFAAAHQPVIVVLSEGTSLSVQAVVSHDRRFVRLTLVPFFSKIGEVKEFTFNGRTTTRTGTGVTDPANPANLLGRNNEERITEGTTVQLPTFAFTTVTTTVSVPDGGTVLLGGVKRLSEGRNERGVPLLTKIPYVNRLFKNVGIGRTTRSLMMMVTPRIIIQEEEEERSVGRPLNN